MDHLFPYQQNWQVKPKVGNGAGEFSASDIRGSGELYLYHAIHIEDDTGLGRLALRNERIDGTFITFDGSDEIYIVYGMMGKGMPFRNGTTEAIARGATLVGEVRAGATPEAGYVQPVIEPPTFNDLNEVRSYLAVDRNARGIVREPSPAHATLTNQSPADVFVEFGMAASK